jgi:hypothetical protein
MAVLDQQKEVSMVTTDVSSLKVQHRQLEDAISEELQRPSPDPIKLTEMKRQKLRIKDELVRLDSSTH